MLSLLTLAAPGIVVWPRLWVERGEILAQADARDDRGESVEADDARIVVHVVGSRGAEAARLAPPSVKVDGGLRPLSVRVERGAESGWREVTIDVRPAVPKGRFPAGSTAKLRLYLPAKDTAEADLRLRSRLLGKPVWVLGAAVVPDRFGAQDPSVDQVGWDPRLPATVIGVERLSRPLAQISSTDAWDLFGNWSGVDFYASNPLAIRLRLPAKGRLRLSGSVGGETGWTPDPAPEKIAEATVYLADPWQIPRLFVSSPESILREVTAKVQNAFAHRRVALGMPRSLVALILGDPDAGAPRQVVWSRKAWSYYGGLDIYTVWFDAAGRVSNFGLQMYKLP